MPLGPDFPPTHWSLLVGVRDRESPRFQESLDRLCRLYLRPINSYFAVAGGGEEAPDVAQEFLVRLVEGSLLEGYDPARGRFRHYLKGAMRHFLLDWHKAAGRIRRGGQARIVSIDAESAPPVISPEPAPDAAFDAAWAASLLESALEELRAGLTARERELTFRIFDRYQESREGTAKASYGQVGHEFGISETEVRAHLSYARAWLRKILLRRVADTVGSPDQMEAELKELFAP